MADFIKTQNSFADGEVSPEFFAHDNLNGLSGSSYCVYRVNGNVVHRSTKAYPFNF